jgi:BNR repeat-like domain
MEPAEHQTASVAEQIGHRNLAAKRDQRRGLLGDAADPEAVDGPTVGGRWRVTRRPGWCVALALVLLVVASDSAVAASVSIEPPRRISLTSPFSGPCTRSDPNYARGISVETSVAVNPRDPRRILVAWIQDGASTDLVMASDDGGRSFSRILVPGLSACTGGSADAASDPGVAFSSDGRVAYFSGAVVNVFSLNPFNVSVGMATSRSLDHGVSWSNPFMVQPVTHDYWDKPELSVDPRRPSVAYYAFDFRRPPDHTSGYSLLSTTTNRGGTWSAPRKLYDPHTSDSWPATSTILVNRDGSLLDVFVLATQAGAGPAQELAIRSDDGGHTWGSPVVIGRSSGQPVNDPVSQNLLQTIDTLPSQTVAPNGDVYVSWLTLGASNASSRIVVARSRDGGRHWIRHSFGVRGQAAMPSIAVAGDGTVGVLYYSIAPSSQSGNWPARAALQTSRDRARHWSRHPVSRPFNLLTADGENYRGCCFVGDYIGLARMPHGFAGAFSMAKPIAPDAIDVYFTRATTSRRGG